MVEDPAETAAREALKRPDDRSVFEGISSATLLKPGDKVLITIADPWSMERINRTLTALKERFPDVEVTALIGVGEVLVRPGGEQSSAKPLVLPNSDDTDGDHG